MLELATNSIHLYKVAKSGWESRLGQIVRAVCTPKVLFCSDPKMVLCPAGLHAAARCLDACNFSTDKQAFV